MSSDNIPAGLKIISIVFYICSAFLIIFSGFLLFTFDKTKSILTGISQVPFSQNINSGIQMGIIILIIAILFFFIARGLMRGKKWSRIVALTFVLIGFLGSIIGASSGRLLSIIDLVIYGIIASYLIWNRKVKEIFYNNF